MRVIKSAVLAAGVGAVLLGAPAALASGPTVDVTPQTIHPGTTVTVAINCGTSATSATLFGTTLGLPAQIPMQPSTHAGEFVTSFVLPASITPNIYSPAIDCSNGISTTATIDVLPVGGVSTGDGTTATATDNTPTMAGLGLLGLGAVLGGIALRRRRAGSRA